MSPWVPGRYLGYLWCSVDREVGDWTELNYELWNRAIVLVGRGNGVEIILHRCENLLSCLLVIVLSLLSSRRNDLIAFVIAFV